MIFAWSLLPTSGHTECIQEPFSLNHSVQRPSRIEKILETILHSSMYTSGKVRQGGTSKIYRPSLTPPASANILWMSLSPAMSNHLYSCILAPSPARESSASAHC